MKKVTLLLGLVTLFFIGVNAQTTKVSKQIEMLSWLNKAVVDGNQVGGGLHTYADWADMTAKLKTAQVQVGMLVSLTTGADKGTYRLKSWVTNTALPLQSEWERVGDMVVVADMAARDALIDAANTALQKLAVGTMVLVRDGGNGDPKVYVYVEDLDGDAGATTTTDFWYSFDSSSDVVGYIYLTTVSGTLASATDGYYDNSGTPALGAVSGKTKLKEIPNAGITYDIKALGATKPLIALPKSWEKPTIYLTTDAGTYQLDDCWVLTYSTKDAISYQVWSCDVAIADGYTGTVLSLLVK